MWSFACPQAAVHRPRSHQVVANSRLHFLCLKSCKNELSADYEGKWMAGSHGGITHDRAKHDRNMQYVPRSTIESQSDSIIRSCTNEFEGDLGSESRGGGGGG